MFFIHIFITIKYLFVLLNILNSGEKIKLFLSSIKDFILNENR